MKKRIYISIVFIVLAVNCFQAQEQEHLTTIYNSGFTQGALSVWNHEKTTAAFYYPAETNYDNISIYCSIGKWANSKLYHDIYSNGQYVLPSFISIGIPISNFMISVGYNNYYNARTHSTFPVTTTGDPDGTGETYSFESNTKLHTFFNSIKYEVNENFSLGILFGFDVFSESSGSRNLGISRDGFGYSFKTSFLWKPTSSLSLGFNYGFISSIDYVIKHEPEIKMVIVDDVGGSLGGGTRMIDPTEGKVSFPLSYSVKVGYKVQPNVSFDLSLERENWDFYELDENSVFNLRFRSSFSISEQIVLNVGYFTQNNPFWDKIVNSITISTRYKNLQYFSVGVDYLITDSIVLNLSVFDSNQLSGDKYGQTYFSSAISIEL